MPLNLCRRVFGNHRIQICHSHTIRSPALSSQSQWVQRTSSQTANVAAPSIRSRSQPQPFASIPLAQQHKTNKLTNVRKELWEFYLSTGRGANALFEAINIDENGSIHPSKMKSFMEDVLIHEDGTRIDPQELIPYAWNGLEQREAEGRPATLLIINTIIFDVKIII